MIIAQLIGGMGNQMFQYALGRRLAYERGVPLKLDIRWYETTSFRAYKLRHFNIQESFATPAECERFIGQRFDQRLRRIIERRLPWGKRPLVNERTLAFDPDALNAPKAAYLEGYWQSERYFAPIADILREEFTFKTPPDAANAALGDQISSVDAVSLHIRRGDYVSDPGANQLLGLAPLDYYHEAARRIGAAVGAPHFFIFSDDIPWAKANLHIDHPMTFVDHNGAEKDYEDLRLITLCKHHIIANSSFSWWGAWLAQHPGKIVYAPARWGNDPALNHPDRVPATWQRL